MYEGKEYKQYIAEKTVLYAIKRFVNKYGYPPTFRELTSICDFNSTSTTSRYLNILKSKGFIDYKPKIPRSIRIIKND
ncbi:LexA family protein [Priestia flexa]|uniref:LexA family protein n=1 Tax=Priestia flexa TaxID=86664 RepID=UPI002492CA67|nr:transcriptional regulator [Priestia flexa]